MGKAPAFMFFVKDWLSDPQLQCVRPSTRGLWIDLLCYMWQSSTKGKITVQEDDLPRLLRCTNGDLTGFMEDAERYEFVTVTKANKEITLINRRMFREYNDKENNRLRQQRFREKKQCNINITPPSAFAFASPIKNITQLFEKYWTIYPSRKGRKTTRKESLQFFKDAFKEEQEIELLIKATQNYAQSQDVKNGYARDSIRFLKKDFWKDWIDKEEVKPTW